MIDYLSYPAYIFWMRMKCHWSRLYDESGYAQHISIELNINADCYYIVSLKREILVVCATLCKRKSFCFLFYEAYVQLKKT